MPPNGLGVGSESRNDSRSHVTSLSRYCFILKHSRNPECAKSAGGKPTDHRPEQRDGDNAPQASLARLKFISLRDGVEPFS